jgi:hypothetical protein
MKSNFYTRVKFQNWFDDIEAIFSQEVIDESCLGNQSNTIELIGKTGQYFDEICPLAIVVSKATDSNGNMIEKLYLYDESSDEDSWGFIANILAEEFHLDSSDDNQEMLIDSIIEAFITVIDYEPSNLGKIYISKESLNLPKITKKQASKINYFMVRSMAHFNSDVDFGIKPSSVSINKVLLDNFQIIDWLDKYEVIAIAFKE